MELRDSPTRRKRLAPTPNIIVNNSNAVIEAVKRSRPESQVIESPFDAVLAAANITNDYGGQTNNQQHIKIAPNPELTKPPSLPVRKRLTKAAGGSVKGTISNNSFIPSSTLDSMNNSSLLGGIQSSGDTNPIPTTPKPKSSAGNKADKGLRHFSTRVCAKVEEKGSTTYNEVADELVQEIGREVGKCDHKNIRRRVYDALNVLMAIDVIRKDKKDIRWLGLPNEAITEIRQLEDCISATEKRISEKQKTVAELVQRIAALKNLIKRNTSMEQSAANNISNLTNPNSSSKELLSPSSDKLQLPFILVNAPRDCRVHCEMLEDRSQYFFEFDSPFLINEDIELLRLMGLSKSSNGDDDEEEDDFHSWLPLETNQFIQDHHQEKSFEFPHNTNSNADGIGMMGIVGDWDGVDQFLESSPPAIGGMTSMDIRDLEGQISLSSPVKYDFNLRQLRSLNQSLNSNK